MSVVVHVCHARGTEAMEALAHTISQYCRWLPPLALAATCVLLAWLPPRVAMAILLSAALALTLSFRPTPARVARWLAVGLFPERAFDADPAEDGDERTRRAA
jgi:hypothetical protein